MVSFPKHEIYQSTGEDWLGDIPKHWQLLRTKSIFRLVAEPAPKNNDEELLSVYSDIGVKPRRELEERGNKASTTDGYWLVKKGDIIVNKLLAWMGAIGLSEYDGVTSPAYDILRAYKPINSKFYHYLFRNPICINKLKKHSKGIMEMRLRLYFDEFGNIKIPYPPIEDQNRIVEFLDRKTAEIDQAIEQKQRLIKLLKEQKAILIDRAVTKGLNPDVPMRDSGVDWIGEIPEHWKVSKLKFLLKSVDYGLSESALSDGDYKYLNMGHIQDQQIVVEDTGYLKSVPKELLLQNNDILFNRTNSFELVGKSGIFKGSEIDKVTFASYLVRLRTSSKNISEWLIFLMNSSCFLSYIRSLSLRSINQANLNPNRLRAIHVVVPPKKEQMELVEYLSYIQEDINRQVAIINTEIGLYEELRQVYIGQAVTGKIKI